MAWGFRICLLNHSNVGIAEGEYPHRSEYTFAVFFGARLHLSVGACGFSVIE